MNLVDGDGLGGNQRELCPGLVSVVGHVVVHIDLLDDMLSAIVVQTEMHTLNVLTVVGNRHNSSDCGQTCNVLLSSVRISLTHSTVVPSLLVIMLFT